MRDVVLAIITGTVTGFIFAKIKLPIPGPPTLAGLMGIVGIFAGFWLAQKF